MLDFHKPSTNAVELDSVLEPSTNAIEVELNVNRARFDFDKPSTNAIFLDKEAIVLE